jgi:hypothetical protein
VCRPVSSGRSSKQASQAPERRRSLAPHSGSARRDAPRYRNGRRPEAQTSCEQTPPFPWRRTLGNV